MTRRLAITMLLPAALAAAGCGGDPPLAMTATPETARPALEAALDGWKAGKSPADLQAATPPVVFQDPDLARGRKLAGFTLNDAGAPVGTAVRFGVTLTFDDKKTRTVGYRVATTPAVSIYREDGN